MSTPSHGYVGKGLVLITAIATSLAMAVVGPAGPSSASPGSSAPAPAGPVVTPEVPITAGKEFWLALPPTMGAANNSLYIASAANGTATVSVPKLAPTPFSQTVSLTAGTVTQVVMPTAAEVPATTGTTNLGVRVISDTPIAVNFANSTKAASTGYLGLPVDALGTRYRNLSYAALSTTQPSYSVVVGTVDGTNVELTPPGGATTKVTLNKGQTYINALPTKGADPTGTLITSDKPVSVFGGVKCVNIPVGFAACNPIVQQLPPTDSWGTGFLSVRLAQRKKGDTYRVLADKDGTDVTVNGTKVTTLNAGQFWEGVLPTGVTAVGKQGTQIQTSKSALVAQYGNGTFYDSSNGDPIMMLVPPYQQFLNDYLFALPAVSSMTTFYINLVVPTTAIPTMTLNGQPISAGEFSPIGNSGYSGAQLSKSAGTYRLTSPQSFGANAYEWGQADGLGYPVGMSLAPIGKAASVTLGVSSVDGKVGDVADKPCATATVLDDQSNPVAGIPVQFAVTGAGGNNQVITAITDSQGKATACPIGQTAGSGTLTVTAGDQSSQVPITWSDIPVPQIDSQPQPVTVSLGDPAEFSVVASLTPADGTLSYQWQKFDKTWQDIPNATLASYKIDQTTEEDSGTKYRAVVTNTFEGKTISTVSDAATLTIPLVPVINTQPAPVTAPLGQPATFSVAASVTEGQGTLSYQWQTKVADNWVDIPNATQTTYTISPTTGGDNGKEYRVVVTNTFQQETASKRSDPATLTVTIPQPQISKQPEPTSVEEGQTATFSVAATVTSGTLSYQWQKLVADNWVDINNATQATYTTAQTTAADNGTEYRAVVTNTQEGITTSTVSDAATLSIRIPEPQINKQPAPVTTDVGQSATFSVNASVDPGTLSYQWQTLVGDTWVNIDGATQATFTTGPTRIPDDGTEYRALVTNTLRGITTSTASDAVKLTVVMPVPQISNQPVPVTTPLGETAKFVVDAAVGSGELSYQWQKLEGDKWEDIDGATETSYTTGPTTGADNGTKYRVVVTNNLEGKTVSKPSDPVTLTVSIPVPQISKQPVPVTTPLGQAVTFAVEAAVESGELSYQWQKLVNGTWVNIDGATEASYTTDPVRGPDNGVAYRVVVTNTLEGITSSQPSDAVGLTVAIPIPQISKQPVPVTAKIGRTATFAVEAAVESGELSYQWQKKAKGNWVNVDGATQSSYTTGPVTAADNGVEYRVVVTNTLEGITASEPSDAVTLSVPKKKKSRVTGKNKPPAKVNTFGTTMITRANAKTNAGQPIRTRVLCVPTQTVTSGESRYCGVKRSANGMVMLTTYGLSIRVIVIQTAAATSEYDRYVKRTVYVNGAKK